MLVLLRALVASVLLSFLVTFYCLVLFILFLSAGSVRNTSPLKPEDFNSSFSVGIHLGTSYGAVAIRHQNGTVVHVAKIASSNEYVAVMQRLSLLSSQHVAPPYEDIGDWYEDIPRQARRDLRRRHGYPASPDAGVLSTLIKLLHAEAEKYLKTEITSVVVAYPELCALYREEIYDALDYIHLRPLEKEYSREQGLSFPPHEHSAAYAGNSLGLCEHYLNSSVCYNEIAQLPEDSVFTVYYTQNSISTSLHYMRSAYVLAIEALGLHNSIDWDAGLSSLPNFDTPEAYWRKVRDAILTPPKNKTHLFGPVTAAVISGEEAHNPNFLIVMNDILDELAVDPAKRHFHEPVFGIASGAAEFGARVQDIISEQERVGGAQ